MLNGRIVEKNSHSIHSNHASALVAHGACEGKEIIPTMNVVDIGQCVA